MTEAAGGAGPDAERLVQLYTYVQDLGVEQILVLDPSITRGLDYYTGVVYETFLNDLPEIGSVCSGGRYDNLASLYSKEKLPGVGASIGLDRLIAALESLNRLEKQRTFAKVAIACLSIQDCGKYQRLAAKLRSQSIACEVLTEQLKPVQQFALAEKKGIPWVLMSPEGTEENLTLRYLATRENIEGLRLEAVIQRIKG
jgi:histidyl-tRNA synthetase